MRVVEICTTTPATVAASESVIEAAREMRRSHVGDLVVLDADDVPIGIITDRDIAIGVVAGSPEHIMDLSVEDVLSKTELVTAATHELVSDVITRMREHGVRRLPVLDGDELVGIVSLDDVLGMLSEQLQEIADLVDRQALDEIEHRPA